MALGAYLAARNDRKVRIKVGDIEAEARTQDEAVKLLIARAYPNYSKVIP